MERRRTVEPDPRRGADSDAAAGRARKRYLELLVDNLGQPGFRELLIVIHDMDARRDLVFALLHPLRPRFTRAPLAGGRRASSAAADAPRAPAVEAFDLAGTARDHVARRHGCGARDAAGGRSASAGVRAEGPWRGETHRSAIARAACRGCSRRSPPPAQNR